MASSARLLGYVCRKLNDSTGEHVPDELLLEQFIASRSESAFAELLRRHGPVVWGVCQRMLSNQADAEDAFQSTWMVLARKARMIQQQNRLVQWLYGVARHAALNIRKMKQRRARREQPWGETTDVADPIQVVWSDVRPLLDDELACLPAKYQLPVLLCCLQGKSLQDAAKQLAWPIGTVAGRLSRGREILRKRLVKRGIEITPALLALVLTESLKASPLPPALLLTTLRSVLAGAGLAIAVLSPTVPAVMQAMLRRETLHRGMFLAFCAIGLVIASTGISLWSNVHQATERPEVKVPVIEPRNVLLPADPQAVILRWRQVDIEGERPDSELTLHAGGLLTATAFDPALETVQAYQMKINKHEVQDLMQFAVYDQEALKLHGSATFKQLREEFEFEGDQRAPSDTLLTELELHTASEANQFCWYQLASSEAWFHEVPAIRQAAALQRRLRNLLLVMQAGGADAANRLAQQMMAQLKSTYPHLTPFTAADLSGYWYGRENDARQWTFTNGSKFGSGHYFTATGEESPVGLRLVAVTPGPVSKSPTMKRRATQPARERPQ